MNATVQTKSLNDAIKGYSDMIGALEVFEQIR